MKLMAKWVSRLTAALGLIVIASNSQSQEILKIPQIESGQDEYAMALIVKSLAKSQRYTVTSETATGSSIPRIFSALQAGDLDIAWLPANQINTSQVNVLQIPIFRGTPSYYRIYTRKGATGANTARELKALSIGMLSQDGAIPALQNQGTRVSQGPSLTHLGHMLQGGRFDALLYPLFANDKHQLVSFAGLQAQPRTVVTVINPYFYVTPKTTSRALLTDIESGLLTMLESGELAKFFALNAWVKGSVAEIEAAPQNFISIEDPETTLALQDTNKEFWYEIKSGPLLTALF